jgi:uncharacterized membrane protein (DUF485 family)
MQSVESVNLEFERLQECPTRPLGAAMSMRTRTLAGHRNRFVWPLLAGSLGIYFALLIAVLSLPSVMALHLFGELNVGLLLVAIQFLLTIATFWCYCEWAARRYDDKASTLFDLADSDLEGQHE